MSHFSNTVADFFVEKRIVNSELREVYQYGLELLFSDIVNFSIILLISVLTQTLLTGALFLLCFTTLRSFSGGYHAKKHWICRLVTIGTFICVLIFSKLKFFYTVWMVMLLSLIAFGVIFVYAPIENPNKPFTVDSKQINRRRSLLTASAFCIGAIVLDVLGRQEGMVISLTLLAVALLMIVSKFCRERRSGNNENIR